MPRLNEEITNTSIEPSKTLPAVPEPEYVEEVEINLSLINRKLNQINFKLDALLKK